MFGGEGEVLVVSDAQLRKCLGELILREKPAGVIDVPRDLARFREQRRKVRLLTHRVTICSQPGVATGANGTNGRLVDQWSNGRGDCRCLSTTRGGDLRSGR